MRSRNLVFVLVAAASVAIMLIAAAAASAARGSISVLLTENLPEPAFADVIRATPGVASVDAFNTSGATPSAADFAAHDMVVSTGDSNYDDPALFGNRLADYIDGGGVVVQFAYDNWEDIGAHPTGRFESGGYAPFIPGDNQNLTVTLGQIFPFGAPYFAGVPFFTTSENTTPTLAPGATLLANWSDARPAAALKGKVVSVSASPDPSDFTPLSAAGLIVANAGDELLPTGRRAAALKKCKKKAKKVADKQKRKKKLKKCRKKAKKLPV